ncbi:hypothetical protein EVAR_30060_1 [Eumeta japonica]|uniref:Uncharacterized protein n=1 Tax=Eumeta variegata TaxID=151549 RepID=A0A4C1X7N1_EUMVA|nr:hypothetical protein EVAR_30060_1 [Eumeta japonica]
MALTEMYIQQTKNEPVKQTQNLLHGARKKTTGLSPGRRQQKLNLLHAADMINYGTQSRSVTVEVGPAICHTYNEPIKRNPDQRQWELNLLHVAYARGHGMQFKPVTVEIEPTTCRT